VECDGVATLPDPTGVAVITVTPDGENTIVVLGGANMTQTAADVVAKLEGLAAGRTVVLCQLEVPAAVVRAVADRCRSQDVRFVLNASPLDERSLPPKELLSAADPVIVNAPEARMLVGASGSLLDAAQALRRAGAPSAVVTGGADGAAFAGPDADGTRKPPRTQVRDTTGAGDAFAGTLAARLSQGISLAEAVDAAVEAGAVATTWEGARPDRPPE
jgi:ribokinase